jgi:hypothetical protein
MDEPVNDDDLDDFAAMPFEAVPGPEEDDLAAIPSADAYARAILPRLRLAVMVLHKSKPALIEVARAMIKEQCPDGTPTYKAFVDELEAVRTTLEAMAELTDSAIIRFMVAMANLEDDEEPAAEVVAQ